MEGEQFSLSWNNFHTNLSTGFHSLLKNEDLVDVTLAAAGKFIKAHKTVLSVCSPFFKELFGANPNKHPIVILPDISYNALRHLLQFMYQGEVSVSQEEIPMFMRVAQILKIQGLGDYNGPSLEQPLNSSVEVNCNLDRGYTDIEAKEEPIDDNDDDKSNTGMKLEETTTWDFEGGESSQGHSRTNLETSQELSMPGLPGSWKIMKTISSGQSKTSEMIGVLPPKRRKKTALGLTNNLINNQRLESPINTLNALTSHITHSHHLDSANQSSQMSLFLKKLQEQFENQEKQINKLINSNKNNEIPIVEQDPDDGKEEVGKIMSYFPLQTMQDFNELEELLNRPEYKKQVHFAVAKLLSLEGSSNYKEAVRRIMSVVLKDEIALLYSYKGHKGKQKFIEKHLSCIVINSVQFCNSTEILKKYIEDEISIWLSKASERLKKRSNLSSSTLASE